MPMRLDMQVSTIRRVPTGISGNEGTIMRRNVSLAPVHVHHAFATKLRSRTTGAGVATLIIAPLPLIWMPILEKSFLPTYGPPLLNSLPASLCLAIAGASLVGARRSTSRLVVDVKKASIWGGLATGAGILAIAFSIMSYYFFSKDLAYAESARIQPQPEYGMMWPLVLLGMGVPVAISALDICCDLPVPESRCPG